MVFGKRRIGVTLTATWQREFAEPLAGLVVKKFNGGRAVRTRLSRLSPRNRRTGPLNVHARKRRILFFAGGKCRPYSGITVQRNEKDRDK